MAGGGGGHAHRDPLGTVQEEIGDTNRQYHRLLLRIGVCRHEVHGLVQIPEEHLVGELLELCLRITVGCGAVSLDGAEVALSLHQGHGLLEGLGHHHHGLVDGGISMGMEASHTVAGDTGGLHFLFIVIHMKVVHVVEEPALYRL